MENFKFSEKLNEIFIDRLSDGEYRYDLSRAANNPQILDMTELEIYDFVYSNPTHLSGTLTVLKEEMEHDIELERAWGEDFEYLETIVNEINKIIKNL